MSIKILQSYYRPIRLPQAGLSIKLHEFMFEEKHVFSFYLPDYPASRLNAHTLTLVELAAPTIILN